jgi:hypothetical protein
MVWKVLLFIEDFAMAFYIHREHHIDFHISFIMSAALLTAGAITFLVALLIFAMKNRIPTLVGQEIEEPIEAKIQDKIVNYSFYSKDPEKALITLRYRYDMGELTSEQYIIEREKIINQL